MESRAISTGAGVFDYNCHVSNVEASQTNDRPNWLPAFAAAALTLALYAVTVGGTYIYDDKPIIRDDKRIQDPHLWYQLWTKDYFNGGVDNLYRPMVSQSYAFQWWLNGDRPWAFHLVNVLLAAVVSGLVAEFGRKMAGWHVGLIAGLLFAAHPVHSEAIAGIVGRAEILCALGIVGAMLLLISGPMTIKRAIAIFALTVMAMLSKEPGMLSPILLGLVFLVRPKFGVNEKTAIQWFWTLQFWPVAGLILLRENVLNLRLEWERGFLDWAIQPMVQSPMPDRWLWPIALVGHYAQLLVIPTKLSIDYGGAVFTARIDHHDPYIFIGGFLIAAWIALTVYTLVTRRWTQVFCLLGMAVAYSMASNVILIGTIFSERLMYLPSIFFLLLVAIWLKGLPRPAWASLLTILVVLGSIRTFTYVRLWNDPVSFYEYSLNVHPKSEHIAMLLMGRYIDQGRFAEAREIGEKAREYMPGYQDIWRASGLVEEDDGDLEKAIEYYQQAQKLRPTISVGTHLGQIYQLWIVQQAATRQ